MKKRKLVLIIHNVRSAHNVGSLLRTADGLDIERVYICGYTPYPESENDERLAHVSKRATGQIHKTALGAENLVNWSHVSNLPGLLKKLSSEGILIAALEQSPSSVSLPDFRTSQAVALIVGSEVDGLEARTLSAADYILEIPMLGHKESHNVANAATMALYHLRYVA